MNANHEGQPRGCASTTSGWSRWAEWNGLDRRGLAPSRPLTVALFDRYARELVPRALRDLGVVEWAHAFAQIRTFPMDAKGLAATLAVADKLEPVMEAVHRRGRNHLFYSSYRLALRMLARLEGNDCEPLYRDAGAWWMACGRLSTFLPHETMRASFQRMIDAFAKV